MTEKIRKIKLKRKIRKENCPKTTQKQGKIRRQLRYT